MLRSTRRHAIPFLLAVLSSAPASAQRNRRSELHLRNTDLPDVVRAVSRATGRRFMLIGGVPRLDITMESRGPVTASEVWLALVATMRHCGLEVVPRGRYATLAAVQPVASCAVTTHIHPLRNLTPEEVTPVLRSLFGPGGQVLAHDPARSVILAGPADRVASLEGLLRDIDVRRPGQSIWTERIHRGNAVDYARLLRELVATAPAGPSGDGMGISDVLADAPTNTLVIVGTERGYLRLLEQLRR